MKQRGAVLAILSEHKKAILELQEVIQSISNVELTTIVDTTTKNPDCKSIQTILSHVVAAGYSYNIYIRNYRKDMASRPPKKIHAQCQNYITELDNLIVYTEETFENIDDSEIERFVTAEKIYTKWEQYYDIEQLMEHAIVHLLRHRRQIQAFLNTIRTNPHGVH